MRDILPEAFHFLNWGWVIAHVLFIAVVFALGFSFGRRAGR
jgi:hypothetical protein